MIKIKCCLNCKNYKKIESRDDYCYNCNILLNYVIKLYKYFYYVLVCLKYYPEKEISDIVNNIIKLNNMTKNSYIIIEKFNCLYNYIFYKINTINIKNSKIRSQYLSPKTQTFLILIYK